MTIVTKGMGAIIKNIFKPSVKTSPYKANKEQIKKLFEKGVVDRNISPKKIFNIMKKGKK